MAIGYIARDATTQAILHRGHRSIARRGTNNAAEYYAVLAACDVAEMLKSKNPIIYTDSQLVLRQLKGIYAVHNQRLRELHRAAVVRLRKLKATVRWHSREEGDGPLADVLASYRYKEALNARDNSKVQQERIGTNAHRPAASAAGLEIGAG